MDGDASTIVNNTAWMFGRVYSGQTGTNNQLNAELMTTSSKGIAFVGLYAIIFLLGVTGNAVVCWVIGNKKEKSGSDVFMISLAVTDLLSSVLVPIKVIQDILGNWRWHLGSAACEILASIFPISLVASSWTLVLIAVDRFRAIMMPMKRHISKKTRLCGIVFTGVIAIGVSLPLIIKQKYRSLQEENFCLEYFSVITLQHSKNYLISFVVIGWFIPVSIIVVLYCICTRELLKNAVQTDNADCMARRLLQNKKVAQMFLKVSTVFVACALPHAISICLLSQNGNYFYYTYRSFWTYNYLTFALSNMNCCMNPLIYAIRQPEVKAFIKKKWNKLCCKDVQ